MGYVVTVPLMLASFVGGVLLCALNPGYPWLFATISMAISIVLAALFIHDPQQAEV